LKDYCNESVDTKPGYRQHAAGGGEGVAQRKREGLLLIPEESRAWEIEVVLILGDALRGRIDYKELN